MKETIEQVRQQIVWAKEALTCADNCLCANPDTPTCKGNLVAAQGEIQTAINAIEQFWQAIRKEAI